MARISEVTHAALRNDGSLRAPNCSCALRKEPQIAEKSRQVNTQSNGLVVARIRDEINRLRRSGISDEVIAESLRQCANNL